MFLIRALLLATFATASLAQGFLEVPTQNSAQSGIGVISGWHCTAKKIKIDNFAPLVAGSGTSRNDTTGVCGRSDTGFSLLFNWNILPTTCFGCAIHHVIALADGVPFGDVTFTVTNFRTEYMTGASGIFELNNFPFIGAQTSLIWDENKQNFSVYTVTEPYGINIGGKYLGALVMGPNYAPCGAYDPQTYPVRYGAFTVGVVGASVSLSATYADGGQCQLTAKTLEPYQPMNTHGFAVVVFEPNLFCPEFPGGLTLQVDGRQLKGLSRDQCGTGRLIGAK